MDRSIRLSHGPSGPTPTRPHVAVADADVADPVAQQLARRGCSTAPSTLAATTTRDRSASRRTRSAPIPTTTLSRCRRAVPVASHADREEQHFYRWLPADLDQQRETHTLQPDREHRHWRQAHALWTHSTADERMLIGLAVVASMKLGEGQPIGSCGTASVPYGRFCCVAAALAVRTIR